MSEVFSAERLLLNVAEWAAETTSPNAGAGTPAAIGSWWQRQGAYPGAPTEIYLKGQAQDTGWLKQNVINLNVFNVKDPAFGAKGDGVTDDTAAIQAALNAAQAAGGGVVYFPPVNVNAGQFYRLAPVIVDATASLSLDSASNITLVGDGFASKIEMSGDVATLHWIMMKFTNCTNIAIRDLQLSGEGIVNPSASNSFLFNPDTCSRVTVDGCFFGTLTNGILVRIVNTSSAVVTRSSATGGCSTSMAGPGATAGLTNRYAWNYIAGAVVSQISMSGSAGQEYAIIGNHLDGSVVPDRAVVVVNTGGRLLWCTFTGGFIQSSVVTVDSIYIRGCTITTSSSVLAPINMVMGNNDVSLVGNVLAHLDPTINAPQIIQLNANVANASGSMEVVDNVLLMNNTAAGAQVVLLSATRGCLVSVTGNVCIVASAVANADIFIRLIVSFATQRTLAVQGNLGVAPDANINPCLVGISLESGGGVVLKNCLCVFNFVYRALTGIRFVASGGASDWHSANDNNCAVSATATIQLPAGNAGVTQEGPAGPGSQIALSGATPLANVPASQGSLCADTAGGQATALWYKETGVGVSGGTAGWLGVGGYDLVFGALNLSTTLTALFLAPGGDGLATPAATEIQSVMTRPATVRNLRSKVAAAGTGAGTVIHTVRKNGVDTTLTVTVTNTSTTAVADTTHSFTVVAGDLLSVKITKTATITTAQTNCADTIEIV